MIEMVKVVGDALAIFEELTQPVRLILRSHIYSATVENYNCGGYDSLRIGAVKMLRICVGGRTLSHVESVPLVEDEVSEVMAWLARTSWPPDEITSIKDIKARRAA